MATHCSILAWSIPRREEPGGAKSMGVTKRRTWRSNWACMRISKSADQLFRWTFRIGICLVFFRWLDWSTVFWGGRGIKCHVHHITSRVHRYHVKMVVLGSSTVKWFLFLPFRLVLFGGTSPCKVCFGNGELLSSPSEWSSYINGLEFFSMRDRSLLPTFYTLQACQQQR